MQISSNKQRITINLPGGAESIRLITNIRNLINNDPALKEKITSGIEGEKLFLKLNASSKDNIQNLISKADINSLGKGHSSPEHLDYILENYTEQALAVLREWVKEGNNS